MTHWIIKKSWGLVNTNVGWYRISESVRAYVYLILSSQASAKSRIVSNMVSAITAQKSFPNNFENVVNSRVDIREDIKLYQYIFSHASSKVDYSMGGVHMLPSNMNLSIRSRTAGYNNEILVSDGMFSLGRNDRVNASLPESHRAPIVYAPCKRLPAPQPAKHMKRKESLWFSHSG